MLLAFKELVNQCASTIPDDLIDACLFLGIDNSRGYSGSQVTNKLYSSIKQVLTIDTSSSVERINKTRLYKLRDELVYRFVLEDEDPSDYLNVFQILNDAGVRDLKFVPSLNRREEWCIAITHCKNVIKFSNLHTILPENIREEHPKQFDIATSAKMLKELGCKIEIIDSTLTISEGFETVSEEISKKVKKFGGLFLIKGIFEVLKNTNQYSELFERFFIYRHTSMMSNEITPQIPYGYLLNLAVKFPLREEELTIEQDQKLWRETIELAITFINAAYGVQPYSIWDYHFQSGETVVKFLTEIALWDSMFTINQCRPSVAINIVNQLFSFISDETFRKTVGFTRYQFMEVSSAIHSSTPNSTLPTIINRSELSQKLKLVTSQDIEVVLSFFSHHNAANLNYKSPSDYLNIDFPNRPLIKLENGEYVLVNKSWCSPSYFEALATAFRPGIKNFEGIIGGQLEALLESAFIANGIAFYSGNYYNEEDEGECDFIIESSAIIILLEVKKKVLTRKAKSGEDIKIMLDLSESLIDAQLQAGRTEIILLKNGKISLIKNGVPKIISLNGRKIERVTLTQLEFGALQDRNIAKLFLTSLLTHSFAVNSTDLNISEKFIALEAKRSELLNQYEILNSLDSEYSHNPFFNCWFFSLPQLLEIINLSSNNESFCDNLCKTKFMTYNTLDWYLEFDLVSKLKTYS
jgi:hypothetical protein